MHIRRWFVGFSGKVLHSYILIAAAAVFPTAAPGASDDPDTDGDGLSDFREIHKYFTNPRMKDSDGDGKADGDWDERREYAYSVRTVLRVLKPFNEAELCDDFQDGRVVSKNDEYAEIEFVHYPFNTVNERIDADGKWRERREAMRSFLEAGITTNWDEAMRADMLAGLAKDGIDIAKLSDKEAAQQVARWVLKRCEGHNNFNAFHFQYASGRPEVVKGREANVRQDLGDPKWSFAQQAEHEVLGREMYFHKTRGTCTSSAVLLTTALRAVGIPTRIVLCTPLVDASTPGNMELVRKGVTHERLKANLLAVLEKLRNSNASHTFNEVFVGGRWRRLNYDRLGQGILDPGAFGMLTHVHTFNDLSEAGLERWGGRKADGNFPGQNAYVALEVSDQFGAHASVANDPVEEDAPLRLKISKVYWLDAGDLPKCVQGSKFDQDGSGHLFLHADRPDGDFDSAGDFKPFYEAVSKEFKLTAKGQAAVTARAQRGYWVDSGADCREFYVRIDAKEMKKLKAGVAYKLEPVGGGDGKPAWVIAEGIEIAGPKKAEKAAGEKKQTLTISKARWLDDKTLPKNVRESQFDEDGSGHLFLHVDKAAWAKNGDDFKAFYEAAPKEFKLTAEGQAAVSATAERGYWLNPDLDCREFYVRITPEEMKKMQAGVEYKIEVADGEKSAWKIGGKVRVKR